MLILLIYKLSKISNVNWIFDLQKDPKHRSLLKEIFVVLFSAGTKHILHTAYYILHITYCVPLCYFSYKWWIDRTRKHFKMWKSKYLWEENGEKDAYNVKTTDFVHVRTADAIFLLSDFAMWVFCRTKHVLLSPVINR